MDPHFCHEENNLKIRMRLHPNCIRIAQLHVQRTHHLVWWTLFPRQVRSISPGAQKSSGSPQEQDS